MTRRQFIANAGLAASAVAWGAGCSSNPLSRKKIPVGLQLYSLREQCKSDLAAMLAAVSRIGYRGVEFAGYYGHAAKDIRKMLDDNGLVACGTHTPYESVLEANLKETIEFNRTIGNKFLIVPWMTGKTAGEWLDKAKLFNKLAERLKPEGMWTGYHAHAHDFEKLDGVPAWDLFFGNTVPEVIMQLDTSNCLEGGADPVAVLNKYPGRARTIHLKANGGGPEAVIGEDKVNWPGVFSFCESKGNTQWYIVEHESSKNPLDAVTRSFAALKQMGKV